MATNRQYDQEYKIQAVKLAKEIGQAQAARELGIPQNTLYTWIRANRLGNLDFGAVGRISGLRYITCQFICKIGMPFKFSFGTKSQQRKPPIQSRFDSDIVIKIRHLSLQIIILRLSLYFNHIASCDKSRYHSLVIKGLPPFSLLRDGGRPFCFSCSFFLRLLFQ